MQELLGVPPKKRASEKPVRFKRCQNNIILRKHFFRESDYVSGLLHMKYPSVWAERIVK
jgi:hypothetical protein